MEVCILGIIYLEVFYFGEWKFLLGGLAVWLVVQRRLWCLVWFDIVYISGQIIQWRVEKCCFWRFANCLQARPLTRLQYLCAASPYCVSAFM